jgi:hypothetical protein
LSGALITLAFCHIEFVRVAAYRLAMQKLSMDSGYVSSECFGWVAVDGSGWILSDGSGYDTSSG